MGRIILLIAVIGIALAVIGYLRKQSRRAREAQKQIDWSKVEEYDDDEDDDDWGKPPSNPPTQPPQ